MQVAGVLDRPLLRGWLHTVMFVITIPAAIVLLAIAADARGRTAAAIYAGSLLAVFGTSAAYHRISWSGTAHRVMQRLDHSMIYLLIAGSYVPICLIALPLSWGIPILSFVGAGAVVGIALKATGVESLARFASALYPILGWALVAASPVLVNSLTASQFVLVLGGGVAYTVGFPVLMMRRPDPWPTTFGYHEIWHACTVLAASLHFAAVTSLLVRQ